MRSQFHGERGHFFRLGMSVRSRKKGVFFNRIREFKKLGKYLPGQVRLPVGNTDLRLALCTSLQVAWSIMPAILIQYVFTLVSILIPS